MRTYKKNNHGFTTFELLLVLAVVIVLGVVVVMEYSNVSQKSRDTDRRKAIDLISLQVQVYQAEKDVYPTLANLNSQSFIKANFKNLDPSTLKDPKAKTDVLVATPTANYYAYQPTPVGCDNAAHGNCTAYTLTATLEGGGTYTKTSQ